jgi:hypothetical protein
MTTSNFLPLLITLGVFTLLNPPVSADDAEVPSELFQKTRLVYEDTFDGGTIPSDFWEIRQGSTWEVKDGVLTGTQSPKEFQEKMLAKGDKAHAGFKPVIWLKQVPENFVCRMRVRYNAEAFTPRFPLFDLGHHIHTLTFSEKATTLTIKKDVATLPVEKPLFSLNEWHDVVIELKKGTLLFQVDETKYLFENPEIDMTGQAQIDFKGIDFGSCQIDHIKVWEGL